MRVRLDFLVVVIKTIEQIHQGKAGEYEE